MILNSHTELGLPVREVEGAVSVAEECWIQKTAVYLLQRT